MSFAQRELLHSHPHLHALVTDGAFAPDGTYIAQPELEPEPFEKLWQRKVFELLKRGKIDESVVTQMRGWQHSGFGVHHAVRLDPDDPAGRERLAHYMLRCPFSLDRTIRVTRKGKFLYQAERKAGRRSPSPPAVTSSGTWPATATASTPWTSSPSSASTSPIRAGTDGRASKALTSSPPRDLGYHGPQLGGKGG